MPKDKKSNPLESTLKKIDKVLADNEEKISGRSKVAEEFSKGKGKSVGLTDKKLSEVLSKMIERSDELLADKEFILKIMPYISGTMEFFDTIFSKRKKSDPAVMMSAAFITAMLANMESDGIIKITK